MVLQNFVWTSAFRYVSLQDKTQQVACNEGLTNNHGDKARHNN